MLLTCQRCRLMLHCSRGMSSLHHTEQSLRLVRALEDAGASRQLAETITTTVDEITETKLTGQGESLQQQLTSMQQQLTSIQEHMATKEDLQHLEKTLAIERTHLEKTLALERKNLCK